MVSERKLAANRANAHKSTGPKTEQGKNIAKQNAIKHGMYSTAPLLPDEDPVEFQAFRDGIIRDRNPAGAMEELLVDRIVSLSWRLRRIPEMESWLLQYKVERMEETYERQLNQSPRLFPNEAIACHFDFNTLSQHEQRLQRGMQSALRQLMQLQKVRNEATEEEMTNDETRMTSQCPNPNDQTTKIRNEPTDSHNSWPGKEQQNTPKTEEQRQEAVAFVEPGGTGGRMPLQSRAS